MFRLLETVKIFKRIIWNIEYHNARMNRSRRELFGIETQLDLTDFIKIPNSLSDNLFKCRISYSDSIHNVEFHPYAIKPVAKLYTVYDDSILYDHKYEDRGNLQKHLCNAIDGEILIVKNGLITDTSYSNVVFSDNKNFFTPSTPLLRGTKREKLLEAGRITEAEIRVSDLYEFKSVYLINALIDLEDKISVPIENIVL